MSNQTPTPHIAAKMGDIAKTVLMPGDPLRARFVAEHYFENPVLFNNVRGVQGYTGTYRGQRVSVMASGMGMPSMGIYSYELYHFYGVEAILRIGSAGSVQPEVRLRDLVFGMSAYTTSAYGAQFGLPGTLSPVADYDLLETAVNLARAQGARYHVGPLLTSDCFYDEDPEGGLRWQKMGVLAVEMETAALYLNAARAGKKALAICTVSDSLVSREETTAAERETSFTDMITLALDVAAEIEGKAKR